MVDYRKKASSGVAKTALGIGIGALGLQAISGGGIASVLRGGIAPTAPFAAPAYAAPAFVQSYAPGYIPADPSCGCYVTKSEMGLIRENGAKDAVIAQKDAEIYVLNAINASLAPVYDKLEKQREVICALESALAMESERRECGDEKIQTYVDGNFIKASKTLDSRHINYHGCEPVIRPRHRCGCCGDGE